MAKVATRHEVLNQWTIKDLLDCHELLDIELENAEYARRHPGGG
jgi:hypothetical protein